MQDLGGAAGLNGMTSEVIPVNTTVKAGDTVIVEAGDSFRVPTFGERQRGQSYTRDVLDTGNKAAIFSAHIGTDITAPGSITVTFSSNTNNSTVVAAAEFSGLVASGALDKTASASGLSDTPSSGLTATTTQANELLLLQR